MNAEDVPRISVIDPIDPAITKVKEILFSPFDLGRWFIIGFCAWLATLGENAGPNFNFSRTFSRRGVLPVHALHEFRMFVNENLALVIVAVAAVFILSVAITILILWLSSRGRFMFLYCVAQNKAEVKNPWRLLRQHANSLFLFRLIIGLISLLVFAILAAIIGAFFVLASRDGAPRFALIMVGIFAGILVFMPLALVFAVIGKFTKDFVVPIMYIYNCTCVKGWKYLMSLLSPNKGRFTLYILFQIVIALAIGAIITVVMCCTLGCACCFLIIPYIGTVAILPLLTFQRAYSLLYLRQYGPNFDVFRELHPQSAPSTNL